VSTSMQTSIKIGQLRLARITNPREDPMSTGKVRPVVLVEPTTTGWLVMGLTTQPRYKTSGAMRVPVPNPLRVGLFGPGFLWGSRLTHVGTDSIHKWIGWIDAPLVRAITGLARVDHLAVIELYLAADLHDPRRYS